MQRFNKLTAFLLIVVVFSCKKTPQDIQQDMPNPKPPVADAGRDQYITIAASNIVLDGSASFDPDGTISSYMWRQISGPDRSVIVDSNNAVAKIFSFVAGVYQFRLRVWDNFNAAYDTVVVIVRPDLPSIPVINTQLSWVTPLSIWRVGTTAAAAAGKVLFAGGVSVNDYGYISGFLSRVDIYDINTQTWSIAELSEARYNMAAASSGNKIVFAGGESENGSSSRVDIYDVSTNTWSASELSGARKNIAPAAAGSKILFAGGEGPYSLSDPVRPSSNKVDIYDAVSNTWSTTTLSEARSGLFSGAADNKILFAGGYNNNGASKKVDIYNAITGAWTTDALGEVGISASTSAGNTILFVRAVGGGYSGRSKRIDRFDAANGSWSIDSLDRFNFLNPYNLQNFIGASSSGNKAVFIPVGIPFFLIYDVSTHTWAMSTLIAPSFGWETAVVSANNEIYIAGWEGVWRLRL